MINTKFSVHSKNKKNMFFLMNRTKRICKLIMKFSKYQFNKNLWSNVTSQKFT